MYLRKNCINKNFEGWNVATLGDITVKIWDGTHATPKYMETGIPFYSVENVTADDFKNTKYISEEEYNYISRTNKLKFGDILMTRIGSLGETKLIDWEPKAGVYVSLAVISPNEKVLNDFLYQYTRSYMFKKEVLKRSLLNAIPQKINLGEIQKIPILLPPIIEQQKIASILSTWDEAIDKYDSLIYENHQLKKAYSQKLFNFDDNYTEKINTDHLTDIAHIGTGNKNNNENVENGKYPFYVRSENVLRIDEYAYDGEAILVPGEGKIGEVFHYVNGKFNYHQRVYCINEFSENINGLYLYYYLQQFFLKQAMKFTSKATVDSLRMEVFEKFPIHYPKLEHQRRIAGILSSMDEKINLLEEMKYQLQEQKRGLMQLLLTGKVRV